MQGKFGDWAPLENVSRLLALVERCESRDTGQPGIGCFYGASGRGKTTAGIVATNTYNAVHVEAIPLGGINGLLEMIAGELGLRPARMSATRMFVAITQELAISRRPLIIDEADLVLRDRSATVIRQLHDKAGVPVILMGLDKLPAALAQWEQLHGRILAWSAAEPATAEDVDLLARRYAPGIEVAADLRARILEASRGSLRYVTTNLATVRLLAVERGLRRVSLDDWGATAFHSVEPPAVRRGAPPPPRPERRARRVA